MPARFRRALFDECLRLELWRAFSRGLLLWTGKQPGGAVRAACVEPPNHYM